MDYLYFVNMSVNINFYSKWESKLKTRHSAEYTVSFQDRSITSIRLSSPNWEKRTLLLKLSRSGMPWISTERSILEKFMRRRSFLLMRISHLLRLWNMRKELTGRLGLLLSSQQEQQLKLQLSLYLQQKCTLIFG